MSSNELILEILSEDIPASMQFEATEKATFLFKKLFEKTIYSTIEVCISKERMSVLVKDLESNLKNQSIKKRGPKENGEALDHFIKLVGAKSKDELIFENDYYYFIKEVKSESISDFIPKMLFEFLRKMHWPKAMKWHNFETNEPTIPWVRPIRSIACVYNQKIVSFKVEGLGINTVSYTRGNRFESNNKIEITGIDNYKKSLEKEFIIVDQKERYLLIKESLINTGAFIDEDLLKEITGLVDYPFIIESKIDEKFLSLPKIVLKTVMKVHQKYFQKGSDGFVIVTDMKNSKKILKGHERVLKSRLSDAKFFYDMDKKKSLESLVNDLEKIVYHEKLGSVLDKVKRIESLMETEELKIAARICKADTLTNMVKEFPELQGVMGYYYCGNNNISEIIKDHLLLEPTVGAKLALRDRMDTLVGFFGIGIKPTGSKDPYALRRASIIILKILIKDPSAQKITDIIKDSIKTYGAKLTNNAVFEDVFEFISEKLSTVFNIEILDKSFFKEESLYNSSKRLTLAKDVFKDFSDTYKRLIGFKKYFDNAFATEQSFFDFNVFDISKANFEEYLNKLIKLNEKAKQFLDTTLILSDDMVDRKRNLYIVFKMYQTFFVFFRGIV